MEAPTREWRPTERQELFLQASTYEVLFGGAAGGGKSEAGLVGALRHVNVPTYRALLLRRSYPELIRSLIPRSQEYYRSVGGVYVASRKEWLFPSGAKIEFGHVERDTEVHKYQSAEYQYVYFDELTTFTEFQYRYLQSRMRSAHGIPVRLRAGTNPPPDERGAWVLKRFAAWLYKPGLYEEEYAGPYLEPEQEGLFAQVDGKDTLVDPDEYFQCDACSVVYPCTASPLETTKECHHPSARSRVFIPSFLQDNPYLAADGEYARTLQNLDPVTYAQLAHGDWFSRPAPGLYFQKGQLPPVDTAPLLTQFSGVVRYWDRAATEAPDDMAEYKGPDWTAGVLMGLDRQGMYWVLDVVRFRGEPPEVERRILETTQDDARTYKGLYTCVLEQDPGQAGKVEIAHWARILSDYPIDAIKPTGNKLLRAKPWSSQARLGRIRLVRAPWNDAYQREHYAFPSPNKVKDDQVDASSGARWYLSGGFEMRERKRGKPQRLYTGSAGGY